MSYRDDFKEVQREAWWSVPRLLLAVLAFIIMVYALGFLATGGDLAIYSFWAPKQANAERKVFENSQSFVEGKIQNIGQLCFAESKADGPQKAALDAEIRNEAMTVHETQLPIDERSCVDRAKGY